MTEVANAGGFKITRHVTLPQLKWVLDTPFFLRFEAAMFVAEKSTPTRTRRPKLGPDGKPMPITETNKKAPPMLCKVTNLVTGKLHHIIINTVLESILEDDYPEEDEGQYGDQEL